jgi:hypothetical protein
VEVAGSFHINALAFTCERAPQAPVRSSTAGYAVLAPKARV